MNILLLRYSYEIPLYTFINRKSNNTNDITCLRLVDPKYARCKIKAPSDYMNLNGSLH